MTQGKITLVLTGPELEALRSLLDAYADGNTHDPDPDLDSLHDYLNDV